MINQMQRDKMIYLLGQIASIKYPMAWKENSEAFNDAYYDLIDSIFDQYKAILAELIDYKED